MRFRTDSSAHCCVDAVFFRNPASLFAPRTLPWTGVTRYAYPHCWCLASNRAICSDFPLYKEIPYTAVIRHKNTSTIACFSIFFKLLYHPNLHLIHHHHHSDHYHSILHFLHPHLQQILHFREHQHFRYLEHQPLLPQHSHSHQ